MDLPGVGPRLRERLREHYGDEEKALKAVRDGDLLGLCSTLSERQALQLVQYARALKFRVSPDEFLATDEAVRIYSLLISRLAGFAQKISSSGANQKWRILQVASFIFPFGAIYLTEKE